MSDDITNELYIPLTSTIVLKRKQEMLYDSLVFENGLAIDALVDSGADVSAIAQKELLIDTTHGLIVFHIWQCKSKVQ